MIGARRILTRIRPITVTVITALFHTRDSLTTASLPLLHCLRSGSSEVDASTDAHPARQYQSTEPMSKSEDALRTSLQDSIETCFPLSRYPSPVPKSRTSRGSMRVYVAGEKVPLLSICLDLSPHMPLLVHMLCPLVSLSL